MSFINWGAEGPEQLAMRRQIEEMALMEQAARLRAARNAANVAVAGSGGATSATSTNGYIEDYVDDYFE
jgi:hypothetical protein